MSSYYLMDKQSGYDTSINCRNRKLFRPFYQVVWKRNNVSVARLRDWKWANTVNSDSFICSFHWDRQQRSFIDGARAFFYGALNTSAAPMLDIIEHTPAIVTQSQLLISLKSSHVSGCHMVTVGQNFVTQGTWNDQLGTNARFSSTCRGP